MVVLLVTVVMVEKKGGGGGGDGVTGHVGGGVYCGVVGSVRF